MQYDGSLSTPDVDKVLEAVEHATGYLKKAIDSQKKPKMKGHGGGRGDMDKMGLWKITAFPRNPFSIYSIIRKST